MKYEIFKTDDYLLVVDDSEIKEGDYRMNIQRGYVKLVDDAPEYYNQRNDVFKKVIAHLPLNNSPILDGVDLLPPLEQEDDVEKLAKEQYPNPSIVDMGTDITPAFRDGFQDGFLKAKEKYKFTEEDMRKAFTAGMEFIGEDKGSYGEFIQSLSQPKMPIGFECEPIYYVSGFNTTTNSQGQTVWVGKYIY